MPTWAPPTIILTYTGVVTLLALASAFSQAPDRREDAYKVLRSMLPWSVVTVIGEAVVRRLM